MKDNEQDLQSTLVNGTPQEEQGDATEVAHAHVSRRRRGYNPYRMRAKKRAQSLSEIFSTVDCAALLAEMCCATGKCLCVPRAGQESAGQ